ncbi:alpha/beta fold hydrolase [Flavitalea sp.]|nr:alpha/beta hydrolase [Flavitalea sp.]
MRLLLITCFLVSSYSCFSQDSSFVADINLENVEYPFPVKYISLNSQQQSLRMAYMDLEGQEPTGEVILLLHGKNFCAAYWEQTARDLSAMGFRVIMPDQVGFGKSTKPEHYQYSFQQLAQNTRAILDTLYIRKVIVLGHSMGGMLATRFALMYPEMTDKLILENPLGLEDWKLSIPYTSVDYLYQAELRQNYKSIKQYQLTNYYNNKWKPEYEKWVGILAGWTKNRNYSLLAWNSALTYDMIFTQPVVYEFKNLSMPVLLIIGQRDRTAPGKANAPAKIRESLGNYPKLGRQTARQIASSRLVELDNVGHLPHIEAYDRFRTALLKFLVK